MKIHYLTRN
jgi:hypothetical protein